MAVGVRELKAKLSEHLERASHGEHITVTDRGRPIAMLVPLPGPSEIERGIDEGWIEPHRRSGLPAFEPRSAAMSSTEVLNEDRG